MTALVCVLMLGFHRGTLQAPAVEAGVMDSTLQVVLVW